MDKEKIIRFASITLNVVLLIAVIFLAGTVIRQNKILKSHLGNSNTSATNSELSDTSEQEVETENQSTKLKQNMDFNDNSSIEGISKDNIKDFVSSFAECKYSVSPASAEKNLEDLKNYCSDDIYKRFETESASNDGETTSILVDKTVYVDDGDKKNQCKALLITVTKYKIAENTTTDKYVGVYELTLDGNHGLKIVNYDVIASGTYHDPKDNEN